MTCLGLPWHALTRGGIFCRLPLGFLAFVGFFLVLWLLVLFEFVVFAGSVFDVCIFLFFLAVVVSVASVASVTSRLLICFTHSWLWFTVRS
jgi:hypothetical protein